MSVKVPSLVRGGKRSPVTDTGPQGSRGEKMRGAISRAHWTVQGSAGSLADAGRAQAGLTAEMGEGGKGLGGS